MKGERFFLVEIGAFLRASPGGIAKFLRREGLLRAAPRGSGRAPVLYTSARGVALAVAHFRAIQGAAYQRGKDPLGRADRVLANRRRKALLGGSATG